MTQTIDFSAPPADAMPRVIDGVINQQSDELSLTVRHRRLARRRAETSGLRPEARM